MAKIQKIRSFLWFDTQAKEAAEFYCSLFNNSTITTASPMVVEFELEGTQFMAINGGPQFKLNESFSLFVSCKDQDEVDYLWQSITQKGGEESMCGWCKDRFGLSWQLVPERFSEMMKTGTADQNKAMFDAMFKMRKLDLPVLEAAWQSKKEQ
ncbi:VOC family protein [bacterium]|nr:VOC family protein [bacterium]